MDVAQRQDRRHGLGAAQRRHGRGGQNRRSRAQSSHRAGERRRVLLGPAVGRWHHPAVAYEEGVGAGVEGGDGREGDGERENEVWGF